MRTFAAAAVVSALLLSSGLSSPAPPAQPRGWGSWYNYFSASNESETLAAASYMSANLLAFGYDTLVIDEAWAESPPGTMLLDGYGRPTWNTAAYPRGLPWLASQLSSAGLKLGVWLVRGVPREAVARALPVLGAPAGTTCADAARRDRNCSWSSCAYGSSWPAPAARAYYASVAAALAAWGVRAVKADCLFPHLPAGQPQTYFDEDLRGMTEAFAAQPSITLMTSPGISVTAANASWLADGARARAYRIAEDVLDVYDGAADGTFPQGLHQKFAKALEFEALLGANGTSPDFDNLQLGRVIHAYGAGALPPSETRLTRAEQAAEMALFCFTGVPLIIGGRLPLPDNDANASATLRLLTNAELLAVHNGSATRHSFAPAGAGELYGWAAEPAAPGGADGGARRYAALFRAAPDTPGAAGARFVEDLGMAAGTAQVCLRDLIAGTWVEPVGAPLAPTGAPGFTAGVDGHGARAFLVTAVGDAACRTGLAG